jgi:hypothetical protein
VRQLVFHLMRWNCCPCTILARVLGRHPLVYRVADWEEALQGWQKWEGE